MTRSSSLLAALLLVSLLAFPSTVAAQDKGPERFWVEVQIFQPMNHDTLLGVSDSLIPGGVALLPLETVLGLDDEPDRERFRVGFRFARRHEIELAYLDSSRSGTGNVSGILAAAGVVPPFPLPIDPTVTARFDTEDLEFSYKYYFVANQNVDFGLSIGAHRVSADLFVSADTSGLPPFPGGGVIDELEGSLSEEAPLPVIGLHGSARLTKNLRVRGMGKVFTAEVEDFSGDFTEFQVSLEARLLDFLSVGAGLYSGDLNIDQDVDPAKTEIVRLDRKQDGLFFFLRLGV